MKSPHVITEVPLDLSDDGRDRIALEGVAPVRVVTVDRLHQSQRGDLGQILDALAPAAVLAGDALRHGQPRPDDLVTQGLPLGPVGKTGQVDECRGTVGGVMADMSLRGGLGAHGDDNSLRGLLNEQNTMGTNSRLPVTHPPYGANAPTDAPPVRSTTMDFPTNWPGKPITE